MQVPAALYIALALAASAAPAPPAAAWAEALAAAEGDMRKLVVAAAPVPAPAVPFEADGAEKRLADLAGEVVVLNFWATWCPPCREEMPTLAALQRELGDEGVRVVTLATGRQDPAEVEAFLAETAGDLLPRWRDPRQELARAMGVLGLPVTVILDRQGREVARLQGHADWSTPEALSLLRALAAA